MTYGRLEIYWSNKMLMAMLIGGSEKSEGILIKCPRGNRIKAKILIIGFPGIGHVGKIAVDYLIEALKAKPICDVYFGGFPPEVEVGPDGIVDLAKGTFYYWSSNKRRGRGILIFTAPHQPQSPESSFNLGRFIIDFAKSKGVKQVYTLAAYASMQYVTRPRIYAATTDVETSKMLAKYGVIIMSDGTIRGLNGTIIGLARLENLRGACIMGETTGIIGLDFNAAKAALDTLLKILDIDVNTKPLEERGRLFMETLKAREREIKAAEEKERKEPPSYIG